MVGQHHQLNAHEFEQTPGDGERQGSLVCCSAWGHKESDTTERLKNKNGNIRQKANSSHFLIRVKMGLKAVETTCNITKAFGPELLTNVQCSKKFCRGDESLENEKHSGWPSEVDNDQLRAVIKADPLTTIREVAQELNVNHSMVVRHLKQTGKVKKLDKWVPLELTANQKNHYFSVSSSLILCNNKEPFLNQIVTCDKKWILYHSR